MKAGGRKGAVPWSQIVRLGGPKGIFARVPPLLTLARRQCHPMGETSVPPNGKQKSPPGVQPAGFSCVYDEGCGLPVDVETDR